MLKEQFSVNTVILVFTFPSHGFTWLHLDTCTMCVVMAGVFSLMRILLFHGPSPVYSSLYGHCDCLQLFARTKRNCKMIFLCMEFWYKHKDPRGNASKKKMVQNPGQSSYHQHSSVVQHFSNPVLLGSNLNCFVLGKPTGLSPPSQSLMTPFGVLWIILSAFL